MCDSIFDIKKVKDLTHLNNWWKEIHGHILPIKILPPNKFYITKDGLPVAYFGMHGMECCVCYLGFPTISKDIRRKERDKVYSVMCNSAKKWASDNSYELIYISIQGETAANNFIKGGFSLGDKKKGAVKATHLFMGV